MLRAIGLVLLGILIGACLVPLYTIVLSVPMTLIFGNDERIQQFTSGLTYLLSGATAVWIVYQQLWKPRWK